MAGTIAADTLTHSTAGSLTTDYVVNGSAKAWVNFNGTGTIAEGDSLNLASLTDNGSGNYTVTMSSAMGNANYAGIVTGTFSDSGTASCSTPFTCRSFSTSAMRATGAGTGNSGLDMLRMCVSITGDLA